MLRAHEKRLLPISEHPFRMAQCPTTASLQLCRTGLLAPRQPEHTSEWQGSSQDNNQSGSIDTVLNRPFKLRYVAIRVIVLRTAELCCASRNKADFNFSLSSVHVSGDVNTLGWLFLQLLHACSLCVNS